MPWYGWAAWAVALIVGLTGWFRCWALNGRVELLHKRISRLASENGLKDNWYAEGDPTQGAGPSPP